MIKLWCIFRVLTAYCLIFCMGVSVAMAQESQQVSANVERYYQLLLTRPDAGYLYERFTNSFLDTSDSEGLRAYLLQNAEEKGAPAKLLLGIYYLKISESGQAIETFSEIIKDFPENYHAHYYLGLAYLQSMEFNKSAESLEKALSFDIPEKLAHTITNQLTRVYVRSDNKAKAIALWEDKLSANPNDVELHEDLLELYVDEEMYEQALKICDQLINIVKSDRYELVIKSLRKGDILLFSGKETLALELYSSILTEVGQDSWLEKEIVAQISQIFTRKEDRSGLARFFAGLVEDNPNRISFIRKYAQILTAAGDSEKAIEIYRGLITKAPGDKDIALEYVQVLNLAKNYDMAVEVLDKLIAQFSGDLELILTQASLLDMAEKSELAVKKTMLYLEKSAKDEYAYIRTARMLEKIDQKEQAGKVFAEMIAAYPTSISAREVYADYLYNNDQKDQAVDILVKLAEESDRDLFLRVCKSINGYGLSEKTMEVISDNIDTYNDDPVILALAVDTAVRVKSFEKAIEWGMIRLDISTDPELVSSSVDLLISALKASKQSESYLKTLKDDTKTVQRFCLLAALHELVGEYDLADSVLAKASEINKTLALSQKISILKKRFDWPGAAEVAIELYRSPDGANSRVAKEIVELLAKSGNYPEARKWVLKWREMSPGSNQSWLTEAQLCVESFNYKEAATILQKASVKFDNDQQILTKLISVYESMGSYRDAMRICWKLYENSPNISDQLRWVDRLGDIAYSRNILSEVIDSFVERKSTDKESVLPRLALARLYHIKGDSELRRRELLEVGRLKPDDINIVYEIAQIEEMTGRWQDAVATLNKVKELDKTNRTAQKIASLYMYYGDEQVGVRMLLELSGGYDAPAEDAEKNADMLICSGYYEQVVEYLDTVIANNPGDWRLKYLKAIALSENGQEDEALAEFYQLLSVNNELSRLKNTQSNDPYAQYIVGYGKIFPEEFVNTFFTVAYSSQALSYKRNMNVIYSSSMVHNSARIQLPTSPDMLQRYSISHILCLLQYADESSHQEAIEELKSAGIGNPEILVNLEMQDNYYISQTIFSKMMDKFPDHEGVLACSVLMNEEAVSPEICKKAYNTFREKLPLTAAISGLKLLQTEEFDQEIFDGSLELLKNVELSSALEFSLMLSLVPEILNRVSEGQETSNAVTEVVRIVYDSVRKGRSNMQASGGGNIDYMLARFATILTQHDNYEMLVELINDEVKYAREDQGNNVAAQQQNQAVMMAISGSSGNMMFVEPEYPPKFLPGYPAMILAMFNSTTSNNYYYQQMNVDPEILVEHIDKIEDDIVKLLVAEYAQKKELADKLLADILSRTENVSPGIVYYRACNNWRNGKLVDTLEGLLQYRKTIADNNVKLVVDQNIVAVILSYLEKSEEKRADLCPGDKTEWVMEQGQTAALHLQRSRINTNQRVELAGAMKKLGLDKEAKILDNQIAADTRSGQAQSQAISYSSVNVSSNFDTNKARQLLTNGSREAAAQMVGKYFENLARQVVLNPQVSIQSYYIQQATRFLEENTLTSDCLKAVEPEADASCRDWCKYAIICGYMEQTAMSQEAWKKAYELDSSDYFAKAHYAVSCYESDKQKALELVNSINSRRIGGLAMGFYNMYNSNGNDIEAAFRTGKMFDLYLASDHKPDTAVLGYIRYMCYRLSSSIYIEKLQNSMMSVFDSNRDASMANYREQRDKIFNSLIDKMLTIPELCDFAFYYRYYYDLSHKGKDELDKQKYLDLAWEVVGRYKTFNASINFSGTTYNSKGAIEYLLNDAAATGKVAETVDKIKELLAGNRNNNYIQVVDSLSELYLVADDDFEAAFEDVENARKRLNRNYDYIISDRNLIELAVEIASDRKLAVDLDDIMLRGITSKKQPDFPVAALASYTIELKKQSYQRAREFVVKFSEKITTSSENRYNYIEKNWDPNRGFNSNSPSGAIYYYLQYINNVAANMDSVSLIVPELEYLSTKASENYVYNARSLARNLVNSGNVTGFIEIVTSASLLAEPEEMKYPVAMSNYSNDRRFTIMNALLLNLVSTQSGNNKPKFIEAIGKMPESFGRNYALAYLNNDWDKLISVLAEYYPRIEKLPQESQEKLARFINETVENRITTLDSSNVSDDVLAWLNTTLDISGERAMNEYLNKPESELIGQSIYESRFMDDVLAAIRSINDIEKLNKVFDRADQLWEKASRTGRLQKLGYPFRYYLPARRLDYGDIEQYPQLITFLIKSIYSGECTYNIRGWNIQQLFQTIIKEDVFRAYRDSQTPENLAVYVRAVSKMLGEGDSSIIFADLNRVFQSVADNGTKQKKFDEDIDALAGDQSLQSGEFNLDVLQQLKNYSKFKRIERTSQRDFSEICDYYLQVFASEEISYPYKNAMYNFYEGWAKVILSKQIDRSMMVQTVEKIKEQDISFEMAQNIIRQVIDGFIASERDQQWYDTSRELLSSFGFFYAKSKSNNSGNVYLDAALPVDLLRLATLVNTVEEPYNFDEIFNLENSMLSKSAEALYTLVVEDCPDVALVMFNRWKSVVSNLSYYNYTQMSTSDYQKIKTFIDSLESPEDKYLAAAMLYAIPDKGNDKPEMDYNSRLKYLAEGFSKDALANMELADNLLSKFTGNYDTIAYVKEHVIARVADQSFWELASLRDGNQYNSQSAMFKAVFASEIIAGEKGKLLEAVEKLKEFGVSNTNFSSSCRRLISQFIPDIFYYLERAAKTDIKSMDVYTTVSIEVIKQIVGVSRLENDFNFSEQLNRLIVCLVLTGRMDEFAELAEYLDENKNGWTSFVRIDESFRRLATFMSSDKIPGDVLINNLLKMMQDPVISQKLKERNGGKPDVGPLRCLVYFYSFNDAKILAVADKIEDVDSYGWQIFTDLGSIARDCTALAEDVKKQKVSEYFDKAAELGGEDTDAVIQTKANLAAAYVDVYKDIARAREIFDSITGDPETFDGESKSAYDYCKNKISEAEQQNQPYEPAAPEQPETE